MTAKKKSARRQVAKGENRMPADSTFYNRLLPILLILLASITIILIVVAIGVLVGIIPF